MKIAIVHDWLTNYPAAVERVLRKISDMYPDAPIYTVVYNKSRMEEHFGDKTVYTTYIPENALWRNQIHNLPSSALRCG